MQQNTPFPATVAGAEGNLILYDPTKIDAYALRHAFAQRYADAVDTEGRSTTPPDVLQELMDHKTFETTMTYYNYRELHQMGALPQVAWRVGEGNGPTTSGRHAA